MRLFPARCSRQTHINVLEGENDWVVNEDAAGLLVDGGGDDVRVDGHGHVVAVAFGGHLDGGVLGREELAQVLVEHKHQLGDSCGCEEV